jgi:hypothetical protein
MAKEVDRAKLSRKEIADILKRNCDLYRDEPAFSEYLVELAMYLIEFQYDPEKCDERPGTSEEEGYKIIASAKMLSKKAEPKKSLCLVCGSPYVTGRRCPGCGIRMR